MLYRNATAFSASATRCAFFSCMRLWSIQHQNAYRVLCEQGVLRADERYIVPQGEFPLIRAYSWMTEQMEQRIGALPTAFGFPSGHGFNGRESAKRAVFLSKDMPLPAHRWYS